MQKIMLQKCYTRKKIKKIKNFAEREGKKIKKK